MKKRIHKPHFHVTAGLIWQDGLLLITKRPEGSHLAGLWEFPGGKQKGHEDLIRCLKREIKEELGIDIQPKEHLLTVQHEYENKRISLHVFNCTGLKGSPKPLEGQEVRWIWPKDLNQYSFPPPDRKIIEYLIQREETRP